MMGLTTKQSELYSFLQFYMAESGGVAPSFEEMREALEETSKSAIHRIISALTERGLIRRLPGRARAIEIVKHQSALSSVSTDDLIAELARRGVTTLRPESATTLPGRNLPEPPPHPPACGGSGPSIQSSIHETEIVDV